MFPDGELNCTQCLNLFHPILYCISSASIVHQYCSKVWVW